MNVFQSSGPFYLRFFYEWVPAMPLTCTWYLNAFRSWIPVRRICTRVDDLYEVYCGELLYSPHCLCTENGNNIHALVIIAARSPYSSSQSRPPVVGIGTLPTPHPQASVPPTLWFRGGTLGRERGWGSPNSDEGKYTVVLCIYKYFVLLVLFVAGSHCLTVFRVFNGQYFISEKMHSF